MMQYHLKYFASKTSAVALLGAGPSNAMDSQFLFNNSFFLFIYGPDEYI